MRIIVGFASGGIADVFARLIGQWLSERMGQQFVVENRTGAGSNLAIEAVAKSRQSRQATGIGGDYRDAFAGIAGGPGRWRIRAGI